MFKVSEDYLIIILTFQFFSRSYFPSSLYPTKTTLGNRTGLRVTIAEGGVATESSQIYT